MAAIMLQEIETAAGGTAADFARQGAKVSTQLQQLSFFAGGESDISDRTSGTFLDNTRLPVHRWFRYSAGFSAQWVESAVADFARSAGTARVLDPFCGSGTTLIAAQDAGAESRGVESHPFVARIAKAKLARRSNPEAYWALAKMVLKSAKLRSGSCEGYAPLDRQMLPRGIARGPRPPSSGL